MDRQQGDVVVDRGLVGDEHLQEGLRSCAGCVGCEARPKPFDVPIDVSIAGLDQPIGVEQIPAR